MRILALDHGTVRIGVALSDELKMMASPLEFIPAEPFADVLTRLKALVREKEVELIIIGMPRNMDGSYGPAAEKVREFATALKDALLRGLLAPDRKLDLETYLWGMEVVDFLVEHPSAKFKPEEFVTLLPKLQPRLYSVASSLK